MEHSQAAGTAMANVNMNINNCRVEIGGESTVRRGNPGSGNDGVNNNAPCGACRFLRRKCTSTCPFAPYFSSDSVGEARFGEVHKIFGAARFSKVLLKIEQDRRQEAVQAICFEAQRRILDPVNGCVSIVHEMEQQLQQQVDGLRRELQFVKNSVSRLRYQQQQQMRYQQQEQRQQQQMRYQQQQQQQQEIRYQQQQQQQEQRQQQPEQEQRQQQQQQHEQEIRYQQRQEQQMGIRYQQRQQQQAGVSSAFAPPQPGAFHGMPPGNQWSTLTSRPLEHLSPTSEGQSNYPFELQRSVFDPVRLNHTIPHM